MAMCTLTDVKAIVSPKTVTDAEITSIIALVSGDIAADTGASTSSTDSTLVRACIHYSAAITLQRMKYTGELASQRQIGDSMRSNNVDAQIAYHHEKAQYFVNKYVSANYDEYTIISGRIGIGEVDNEVLYEY